MKELNFWGEEQEQEVTPVSKSKFKSMQEIWGILEGKTCKDCEHLQRYRHNKVYIKCDKWFMSSCAATDIRVNGVACKKWEESK